MFAYVVATGEMLMHNSSSSDLPLCGIEKLTNCNSSLLLFHPVGMTFRICQLYCAFIE